MPPLSKRPYKLQRTPELQTGLHLDILESQRSDTSGYLADTSLMCQGGTIKVHAFILQAASPFFRAAFTSQGAEYPHVREVMLPDFTVHEMEAMLSLIYKGTVNLSSDEEITLLKNTLKFFGVTGVDFKSEKGAGALLQLEIDGNLYVNRFSRIPDSMKTGATEECFREEIEVVTVQEGKASLIKPTTNLQQEKVRDPDDEETDEEDKDWTEPNFKDTAWFKKEALKCQVCDTGYPLVKDVLDCISKHSKQNVRCCFCLRVYPNTEVLYRHYAKRHKSAGRENTIMCHFCDQAVSYHALPKKPNRAQLNQPAAPNLINNVLKRNPHPLPLFLKLHEEV
ncbi:Protein bric-a-brac 2, partial [Orchesella cincta]